MFNLTDIKIFEFQSSSLIIVQVFATLSALVGLMFFEFSIQGLLVFLIFYFLYIGVGISMTLHRYYTHRSFEFKNKFIKKVCTIIGILAGRGSVLGWVYIHREHHAYADTPDDPHSPDINGWKSFLIPVPKSRKNINKGIIKEFFNKQDLLINRFYLLILLFYISILFLISPWLFYFAWALPIAVGHFLLNVFTYAGHKFGYVNFERKDQSKNNLILGLLLFGEGWHNNHHQNPKNYKLQIKWWEIDIINYIIKFIKK
jgi:fatty-acid desaturase